MYIDNVEEIFCIFSDAPNALKSNLYKVSDMHFTVYAIADSEEQALDNLANNDKLLSISIDNPKDDEMEDLMVLGNECRYYSLQYLSIEKINPSTLGSFSEFIENALEAKLDES